MNLIDVQLEFHQFIELKKINFNKRTSKINEIELTRIANCQSIFKTYKELFYSVKHNLSTRPVCSVCGKPVSFINTISGFNKTCSQKCAANDPERNEKIKKTELKRYGGPHTKNEEFKNKIRKLYPVKPGSFGSVEHKKAIKEKYGVDNIFQAPEIKQKIKVTFQKRYGVDNPCQVKEINDKIKTTKIRLYGQNGWNPVQTKLTNLERYGVDNPLKSKKIRAKIKATNLQRYGVEHITQDQTIFDKCMRNQLKSRSKGKEMMLPSGKVIKYQGYENYVINYLLKNDISEDDVELERTNIPTISYFFDGKIRRYYPDVFIKSKNMLIEVKSTYTYYKEVEKNIAKHLASKDAGFHHIIIIWDPINNCIFEIINI
jgi:hypothetical protein